MRPTGTGGNPATRTTTSGSGSPPPPPPARGQARAERGAARDAAPSRRDRGERAETVPRPRARPSPAAGRPPGGGRPARSSPLVPVGRPAPPARGAADRPGGRSSSFLPGGFGGRPAPDRRRCGPTPVGPRGQARAAAGKHGERPPRLVSGSAGGGRSALWQFRAGRAPTRPQAWPAAGPRPEIRRSTRSTACPDAHGREARTPRLRPAGWPGRDVRAPSPLARTGGGPGGQRRPSRTVCRAPWIAGANVRVRGDDAGRLPVVPPVVPPAQRRRRRRRAGCTA